MTFGLELEWADVDRRIKIPERLGVWDTEEQDIVNTDGTAADPKGKKTQYGGEINTSPTDTIDEQVEIVQELISLLKPRMNYRLALHTHIGMPGLKEDLNSCKLIFSYYMSNRNFINGVVFPVKYPRESDFKTKEDFITACKFYKWWTTEIHGNAVVKKYKEVVESETCKGFFESHFSKHGSGERTHYVTKRAGINLLSLQKHGTVEFRIFPGTIDPKEVKCSLEFSERLIKESFSSNPVPVEEYYSEYKDLPKMMEYDQDLEKKYQETKVKSDLRTVLYVAMGNYEEDWSF